jgi:protein-tyrosine phosphatase
MTKILFICHGNICRSVMAEFVMKELCRQAGVVEQFEIASAAVSREEIGNDIYPPAKRKLREKGFPFEFHAARQITRADYAYYDYVICADRSNLRWLERIIGEDTDHKVSLMMAWPQTNHKSEVIPDVSDPWYTGDFEAAYQDIEQSCKAILKTCITK